MLKLLSIKVHHFKNLKEIDLNFPDSGNILIMGKNESGKSTLFEAVYFALTGELLVKGNNKKSYKDAVYYSENYAYVILTFTKGGKKAKIERAINLRYQDNGRVTSSQSVTFWMNFGEPDEIKYDSSTKEYRIEDVKQKIQDFVGFDGDILENSCFVKQKGLDGFIETSLDKKQQIINKLLNLEKLSILKKKYIDEINVLKKVKSYLEDRDLIESGKRKINECENIIKEFDDKKRLGSRYEWLLSNINNINFIELKEIKENYEQSINLINEEIRKENDALEKLNVYLNFFNELEKLNNRLTFIEEKKARKNEEMEKKFGEHRLVKSKIKEYQENKDALHACENQLLELEKKNDYFRELEKKIELYREQASALGSYNEELKACRDKYEMLFKSWTETEKGLLKKIVHKINRYRARLENSEKLIAYNIYFHRLNDDFDKILVCLDLLSKKEKLTKEISELESEIRKKEEIIEDHNKKICENGGTGQESIGNMKKNLSDLEDLIKNEENELAFNQALQVFAEKEIFLKFINRLSALEKEISFKRGRLLRIFTLTSSSFLIVGVLFGLLVNPAFYSLISLSGVFMVFYYLLKKGILFVPRESKELINLLEDLYFHVENGPKHELKFLDGKVFQDNPRVQDIISLINQQVRKFDDYLKSQSTEILGDSKLKSKYYYNSRSDNSYELTKMIKEKREAIKNYDAKLQELRDAILKSNLKIEENAKIKEKLNTLTEDVKKLRSNMKKYEMNLKEIDNRVKKLKSDLVDINKFNDLDKIQMSDRDYNHFDINIINKRGNAILKENMTISPRILDNVVDYGNRYEIDQELLEIEKEILGLYEKKSKILKMFEGQHTIISIKDIQLIKDSLPKKRGHIEEKIQNAKRELVNICETFDIKLQEGGSLKNFQDILKDQLDKILTLAREQLTQELQITPDCDPHTILNPDFYKNNLRYSLVKSDLERLQQIYKEIVELSIRIKSLTQEIEITAKTISDIKKELPENYIKDEEQFQTDLLNYKTSYNTCLNEIKRIKSILEKISISDINNERDRIGEEVKKLKSEIQDISREKENIKKNIEDIKRKIPHEIQDNKFLNNKIISIEERIKVLEGQKVEKNTRAEEKKESFINQIKKIKDFLEQSFPTIFQNELVRLSDLADVNAAEEILKIIRRRIEESLKDLRNSVKEKVSKFDPEKFNQCEHSENIVGYINAIIFLLKEYRVTLGSKIEEAEDHLKEFDKE
ncbi:MAG: AAA family ATPase, partial [Promethearchaeota archaeon]